MSDETRLMLHWPLLAGPLDELENALDGMPRYHATPGGYKLWVHAPREIVGWHAVRVLRLESSWFWGGLWRAAIFTQTWREDAAPSPRPTGYGFQLLTLGNGQRAKYGDDRIKMSCTPDPAHLHRSKVYQFEWNLSRFLYLCLGCCRC